VETYRTKSGGQLVHGSARYLDELPIAQYSIPFTCPFIGTLSANFSSLTYQTLCVRTGYVKLYTGYPRGPIFLIVVLLLMVALIALFAFPPHRWAEWFGERHQEKVAVFCGLGLQAFPLLTFFATSLEVKCPRGFP